MNVFFRWIYLFCSLLFLAMELTSCCGGRRPPVMVSRESCVIDYNNLFDTPYNENNYVKQLNPNDKDLLQPSLIWDEEYRLSSGDVLEMEIFGDAETFVERVTIAPDGCLYYTFVEGIKAEGNTVDEVRHEIQKRLKELYVHPQVSMNLITSSRNTFKILGRVKKPGVYPVYETTRLREAIGLAGGLMKEDYNRKTFDSRLYSLADLKNSFLIRNGKKITPDFEKALFSCDNSQDLYIEPGDYIYIAPYPAYAVYVLGAVVAPQRVPYQKNLTLMQAIARAHGWNSIFEYLKAPNLKKVLVLRGKLDCPDAVQVDVMKILRGEAKDFILMPGDIVYVQDKELRFGRTLVRLAVSSFVESFGLSAAQYWGQIWFPPI